jgi:peptide/nickel transport system substrate-binding protein
MRPVLLLSALLCFAAAEIAVAEEPPALAAAAAAGQLPPLAERLPVDPRRDVPARDGWRPGRYGGTLRTLTRGGRDARDLVLLGYARLVVWGPDYRLRPDILHAVEVEDGRAFTLHLRPGHRWSDGHPFTTEDFRFWWQDVANHPALSPAGPPAELLADGRPPRVEIVDRHTLRYRWDTPNPRFLPALAAASPPFIYRPAHYLKAFHADYADPAVLDTRAAELGLAGWAALFGRRDRPYRFDNPGRPTLQPWVNTSAPPAERYLAVRNPYFHRLDGQGRQLPYIGEVILVRAAAGLITAKTAAGESTLQARGLSFADVALLKDAESRGNIVVRLWPIGRGAQLALYPNLNAADPALRALMRDVRFRRALSLAIDRAEINRVIYQGLALTGANSLLPESPLSDAAYREAWAAFDPEQASRLLDALGLTARDSDGLRLLPDGRPLVLVVGAGDSDPAETDVLELIAESWRAVGIGLAARAAGRQAFRKRVQTGETPISIFYGLANGLATADMSPAELAPTGDRQNNWPLWGRHHQSGGRAGSPPDLPEARRLLDLYEAWTRAETTAARAAVWRDMLAIHADQVFTIGIVGRVLQPVAADARLRNLPAVAPYMYEPGAYLGIIRPDTFWLE